MKKLLAIIPILLIIIWSFTGCSPAVEKSSSLSVIYGSATILSLLLLIVCCLLARRNRVWFVLLFSSVLVVNIGYTALSVSTCLEMALWANRTAYFGSVFLPLAMLMIILDITGIRYPKCLQNALWVLSVAVFLITASQGILPVYYKEVSFAVVNGVSSLLKVYGPLHPLYMFYLLGYFTAMVSAIIRAHFRQNNNSTVHAGILAGAVLVNIGVWFIEQLVSINFEFLSISYIISELFLLSVHLVVIENQQLRELVEQVETAKTCSKDEIISADEMLSNPLVSDVVDYERLEFFMTGLKQLTPAETAIYDAYIARATTKEIMANLNIKESTLKYHNRNLYGKLGVSSRRELLEIYKQIKSMKARLEEINKSAGK